MKFTPLNDRVLIKRIEGEEKTKGGIIIPDSAKEKPLEGEVIAVGKGKLLEDGTLRPLDVKAGNRVLINLQLIDGRSTEGVRCGQHRAFALLPVVGAELADGGGLAHSVDTDDQHHRGALGRRAGLIRARCQKGGDLLFQEGQLQLLLMQRRL